MKCFPSLGLHQSMIENYIPQRGPARMIDRLVEVDSEHAVVEADVPFQGRMVRGGLMPAWVGIELMAQAIAVWAGDRSRRAGRPPRVGYLLGSRRYQAFCDGFAAGSTLRVHADCDFVADSGVGIFSCRIEFASQLLARAQVSVFEPAEADPAQPPWTRASSSPGAAA
jgi:predicted hotdog family 3-hydroxylacyl-ACP dehydratase